MDDDDDEMEEGDYIGNPFISLSYYLCCSIYKRPVFLAAYSTG